MTIISGSSLESYSEYCFKWSNINDYIIEHGCSARSFSHSGCTYNNIKRHNAAPASKGMLNSSFNPKLPFLYKFISRPTSFLQNSLGKG